MSAPLRMINDALALLLELAALAALCYGGFVVGPAIAGKLLLGIGLPLGAAVVWGLFAAPRARVKLPLAGVLAVKALVFAAAVAALFATGQGLLAAVYALLVVANTTVITIQRRATPPQPDTDSR